MDGLRAELKQSLSAEGLCLEEMDNINCSNFRAFYSVPMHPSLPDTSHLPFPSVCKRTIKNTQQVRMNVPIERAANSLFSLMGSMWKRCWKL